MEGYENPTGPAHNLNRFHETSAKFQRYKVLLRRRWWFLLLTAAIAVCYQALRITGKSTEFEAVGKIVANARINVPMQGAGSNVVEPMMLQEFYGTQIELLESTELQRRALERIRSLHPEIKEVPVDIRVTQTKGSSILNIGAVGGERVYTRHYLEALLDEYMAFRQEMINKSIGSTVNKLIEEVLTREKQVKDLKVNLENFLKNNDVVVFEGDRNQAAAYLTQLKNELNLFSTERKLMEKMGLDDYLKQKDRQVGSAGGSGGRDGQSGGSGDVIGKGGDPFSGLSRTEVEYLKALGDFKLLQAERLQMLRAYKPEHPAVRELDDKVERQNAIIEIHRQQSQDEWQRRLDSIKVKIDNLSEVIKEWEVKARDANEKIVMHQALKSEYDRTFSDYQQWRKTLDQINASGVITQDFVNILSRPTDAVESKPKLLVPILIALAIGLAAGLIILLLFDRMDDRMNSFSEFQSLFPNETVLGQIPEQNSRGDVTLLRPNDDRHLYAEAFRNLRSSMLFKNWKGGHPPKLILVTSAVPNEGKTTTVANMAISIASGGARVLLADADLRRGGLNELFKASVSPGFSDVLTSRLHWRDAVQETSTKGLHLLPRGEALDQTSELFLSPLSDEILKEMSAEYDYVIFDSAPVLVADDTASFAPKIEAVLFVVRMSSTMARLSAKALDQLYERQVNVAGVILNRASTNLKEYTYYNYASYYSISKSKNDPKA